LKPLASRFSKSPPTSPIPGLSPTLRSANYVEQPGYTLNSKHILRLDLDHKPRPSVPARSPRGVTILM
ncbi:hypothetical protein FRC09_015532, partial [Ceratobasidium sp. 395]